MHRFMTHRGRNAVAAAALATALTALPAGAGTYTVLYSFTGGADGGEPSGAVVRGADGTLYGATFRGAKPCADALATHDGCGTVYAISPSGTETTLVSFTGANGASAPNPLLLAGSTLYGTTEAGGSSDDGVVFSVGVDGSHFRLLYQFNGLNGLHPVGALQAGPHGSAYGVTSSGGSGGAGVLYELTSTGSFQVVHSFTGGTDGGTPSAIVIAPSGTVYGSTVAGGTDCIFGSKVGCGVVFSYVPSSGVFTVLHDFVGTDGALPTLGSIAANGTLYGATNIGGADSGTLFSLVPKTGALTTLYNFTSNSTGFYPNSGPALAADGSLVGVTPAGASYGGGALYSFANGAMTTLYEFANPVSNGYLPESQPIVTTSGGIFGTAAEGGVDPCTVAGSHDKYGCGTVYSYTP